MRNTFGFLFIIISLFSSCKPAKEKMLLGKWVAIKMESPQLDKEVKDTQVFIDTVGTSTSPDQNFELYGVRNMDSLRDFMKVQMETTLNDQKRMIDNTWLEFMKKDIVATNFGAPQPDTINWYLDEEGSLILDEMKMKGTGDKITMEIAKLVTDTLQLRFNENGYSSTATFIKK